MHIGQCTPVRFHSPVCTLSSFESSAFALSTPRMHSRHTVWVCGVPCECPPGHMLTRKAHASRQMTHTAGGAWLTGGAAAAVEVEASVAEAVEVEASVAETVEAAAAAAARAASTTAGE
eukprot:2725821-Prymnesium_polylepis.1